MLKHIVQSLIMKSYKKFLMFISGVRLFHSLGWRK